MNKFVLLTIILLALTGCETTHPGAVEVDTPEISGGVAGTCIHKYSSERNFEYVGKPRSFQKTLFGEVVWVHEYTLKSQDSVVHLSQDEIANYRCEVVERINTSIH